MRFLRRRRNAREDLSFEDAAALPVPAAIFAIVLSLFAGLALAGVDLPPEQFPFLIPFAIGIALLWVVGKLRYERSAYILDRGGHKELTVFSDRRTERIRLDELVSVSREPDGSPPALTLTDLRGLSVTVPLGIWTNEERLLSEIDSAVREAGTAGSVGSPIPVHKPAWITPFRYVLTFGMLIPIAVLVNSYSEPGVERVTPERVEETRGATSSPFAGSRECDVYVVPMDRPSEGRASDLARALARKLPVSACTTRSLAIETSALDVERGQLDASILLGVLTDQLRAVWGDRPATVLGVTELDLFTSGDPSLRFTFGSSYRLPPPQGFAALSTARMGSGGDRMRRLETMAVRSLGFQHFGLAVSQDPSSAMYHTIRSRSDLDRMRPQFSDPPPTDAELRSARSRFLSAGS